MSCMDVTVLSSVLRYHRMHILHKHILHLMQDIQNTIKQQMEMGMMNTTLQYRAVCCRRHMDHV